MKVALIGTRGVPANYGGFETCAEELAIGLAERGHDVDGLLPPGKRRGQPDELQGRDARLPPPDRDQEPRHASRTRSTSLRARGPGGVRRLDGVQRRQRAVVHHPAAAAPAHRDQRRRARVEASQVGAGREDLLPVRRVVRDEARHAESSPTRGRSRTTTRSGSARRRPSSPTAPTSRGPPTRRSSTSTGSSPAATSSSPAGSNRRTTPTSPSRRSSASTRTRSS